MSGTQGSRAGSMFGPYHLKRPLGRGGMGEVYEAEHTVKGWTVALKLMSESLSRDPVFRERMKREARHTGRLQEPHVVPIHDYGEIDGQLYLEMRLIEGTDLDSLLKRTGPLTAPRAVAIVNQIASALDAAHAAGVMHRDVKPQNILVTPDDFAYLVDFGIASANTDEKLTRIGDAVGTWKYMAPERFSTAEVTHRADIYALACVLYECLTGAPPYASDSAGVLVTAHMMDPVPQPSTKRAGIPRSFDAVIAKGMAKRPDERYAKAGDLALAAHEALTNPDQSQAVDILRRSNESTLPHKAVEPATIEHLRARYAAPSSAPRTPPTPQSSRPDQPSWAPNSGPVPAANQPTPPYYSGGSWGRPPPSAPPAAPQQFAGTGPYNQAWNQPPHQPPPQPPPGRGRNPWLIVAGIALLVVVVVAAAIGIGMAMRNPDERRDTADTTTTTTTLTTTLTTTRPPTTTTSTASADLQRLLRALPAGYPPGACTRDNQPMPGAVVSVKCGANTDPSGPTVAGYGLYPDLKSLQDAFTSFTGTFSIQTCPGGKASPGTWWHTQQPNTILGQIACGIYKGNEPQVMWSNQQSMVFALAAGKTPGPNLDQLYKWWASHS